MTKPQSWCILLSVLAGSRCSQGQHGMNSSGLNKTLWFSWLILGLRGCHMQKKNNQDETRDRKVQGAARIGLLALAEAAVFVSAVF